MLKDQRLALAGTLRKRQPRRDKGQPRGRAKRVISPEYALYLATRDYAPRKLYEADLLLLLAEGCSLCPSPGERVRRGVAYCPRCYAHMLVDRDELALIAWARRVALHRS